MAWNPIAFLDQKSTIQWSVTTSIVLGLIRLRKKLEYADSEHCITAHEIPMIPILGTIAFWDDGGQLVVVGCRVAVEVLGHLLPAFGAGRGPAIAVVGGVDVEHDEVGTPGVDVGLRQPMVRNVLVVESERIHRAPG